MFFTSILWSSGRGTNCVFIFVFSPLFQSAHTSVTAHSANRCTPTPPTKTCLQEQTLRFLEIEKHIQLRCLFGKGNSEASPTKNTQSTHQISSSFLCHSLHLFRVIFPSIDLLLLPAIPVAGVLFISPLTVQCVCLKIRE